MAAGVSNALWSIEDIVALLDYDVEQLSGYVTKYVTNPL